MVTAYYSVCVLTGFIQTDSCLSASWAHAGRRCLLRSWCQQGERRAQLHWAEPSWNGCRGESASPASEGHRFSARKQRLLEQETQPDRTWKPRAAMTHDGHKRRKRSCLLLHLLLLPSPPPRSQSFSFSRAVQKQDPWRRGEKGKRRDDAWIAVAPGWTLAPCKVWSLMLPQMFRGMQEGFKETLIG